MKTINIKTIRIDGGTQSRVEIDNGIVTEYAEAIKAGTEFPAVVIFNDGSDNWLADGFHRFHAYNQAGKTSILADIRTGTARNAVLYSLGANGTHGLNRTNADKRKTVMTMLNDAEWSAWPEAEIARRCLVSRELVRTMKEEISHVEKHVRSEPPPNAPPEIREKFEKIKQAGGVPRIYNNKHGDVAVMNVAGQKANAKQPYKPAVVAVLPNSDDAIDTPLDEARDAIAILSEENDKLNDRLAVVAMEATDEERTAAASTIEELRKENKTLRANLKAVTQSRDTLMNELALVKRQCISL